MLERCSHHFVFYSLGGILHDARPLWEVIARLWGRVPNFVLLEQSLEEMSGNKVLRRTSCYQLADTVISLHLALLSPQRLELQALESLAAGTSLAEIISAYRWERRNLRCLYVSSPGTMTERLPLDRFGDLFPGWLRVFRLCGAGGALGQVWEFLPERPRQIIREKTL